MFCVGAVSLPHLFPLSLIGADFCVGSVCIAFGALLGKVSPVQLLIMTLFQVTLFSVNEYILLDLLHVSEEKQKKSQVFLGQVAQCLPVLFICHPSLP